ncbi:MAG: 4-alpha-glucanotransferase [Flavisolibacter sp.]|nr:4-alpha-glucanotransferase [Flavisolibacter sp.]
MKIHFYLRFHTRFGQSLSITGNIPELGSNKGEKGVSMQFLNEDFWHLSIDIIDIIESDQHTLHYQYIYTSETGDVIKEAEKHRVFPLDKEEKTVIFIDSWNDAGYFENVFFTAPFQEVLLPRPQLKKSKKNKNYTHLFKVKAPLLSANECVCLMGYGEELKNWSKKDPILLEKHGEWWTAALDLSQASFPLAYKYGVYNYKKEEFKQYENGDNRLLHLFNSVENKTVVHDGFVRLSNNTWKGAGVAIPVFSLRSEDSFGVGEFTDIKLLVEWAVETNLKLIQLLPINDTSATFTWHDSYPYAAISAFALHPIYINLQKVAGKKYASSIKSLAKKQKELNSLPELDYEGVMQNKLNTLRQLYELQENQFLKEQDFIDYFESNKHWLVPYAAFCVLRDKWGTSDFNQWRTNAVYDEAEIEKLTAPKSKQFAQVAFYYFVQYHLHVQLTEAVKYAHKRGVILKGDIPIGIYRYGVDAWVAPHLYHMDRQAGAPPDDFAIKGQNWGFPTYNWQRMQEDNFDWWRKRFHQMSLYFDAFRIDHILGFFRIWSIPIDAVEGILGVFVPALPIYKTELGERGIWFDYDRFCRPYITDDVLLSLFSEKADYVKDTFLFANNRGGYDFKEDFNTQQKVQAYFDVNKSIEGGEQLKIGLFDLLSNVLFFEQPDSNQNAFHFRISMEDTTSFQHLEESMKHKLRELYIDYFYRRQDEFWKHEALRKLPHLKDVTNMLICGEDLGMVPHSVPEVMQRLSILSLEIQRMPKDPLIEFFHPANAPYLSVVTPSTHDMSTIRGWWEEDRERTQKFYNTILESHGPAPYFGEPWIVRAIILQHLYSPAMWSIFMLQDLLNMSGTLRRENPHEERINVPAIPKYYWRYRMHLPLERLLKEKEFNNELKDYINNCGRS